MDNQLNDLSESSDNASADEESKSAISSDLIRGHINTIILRTLYERDKYGYEIIEEIERKSHGQYSLKQPTLYSALKRLESQGYINAYWKTDEVSLGGRRKYYTLTENGREIAEKNQAEWEYSRTVIDNLISDRSFDFSQPAPTSVDFKILKKSTSRVPVIKGDDEDDDENNTEQSTITEVKDNLPEIKIVPETVTYTEQKIYYENPEVAHESKPASQPSTSNVASNEAQKQTVDSQTSENIAAQTDEEQRRIVHENYMRLISEPLAPKEKEPDIVPASDSIETEKLI